MKIKYKDDITVIPENNISINEVEFVFEIGDKIPAVLTSVIIVTDNAGNKTTVSVSKKI